MTWTAPPTTNVGDPITASWANLLRDDLNFLASPIAAYIATSETTTSTSYTDLSTVGPTVTLTTGAVAWVLLTMLTTNSTQFRVDGMSFAVSGATTLAAADTRAVQITTSDAGFAQQVSAVIPVSVTPGVNTFTAKYREDGAGTATFATRYLGVWPLP
jgi:hypothetical protein